MHLPDIPISELIPQRPPFVMIDKIVFCDENDADTEFVVQRENIFLDGMKLSAAGIIENMAQSCAARMGCINIGRNESIKTGVIGNISNCEILRYPNIGETLTTHVHVVMQMFNLTLAEVTAKIGNELIAKGRMKIAETEVAEQ